LISSLILGTEGLERGVRGMERVREGIAGRGNSDWFAGGERVGLGGNTLRLGEDSGRASGVDGMGDNDRMLRGPIGLCNVVVLVSI